MKKTIIYLINIYQKTISPDHGLISKKYPHGYCRYYPSCSEYMKISIEQKGVFKGMGGGIGRIVRCNPWSQGGVDVSCYKQKGLRNV